MNKIIIVTIIVVIAAGGAGYYLSLDQDRGDTVKGIFPTPTPTLTPTSTPMPTATPAPASTTISTSAPKPTATSNAGQVKEFMVSGSPFKFSLNEIKVKKGDTVKIVYTNEGGTHDWVIDEFSARTKVLQAGQTETIQFVADKTGTFEYYCSVGSHRQMGMKGNLTVE